MKSALSSVAAVAAVSLLFVSCGGFTRDNPFDPEVPVTVTIIGPDSTTAQFDTVRFTIVTDPSYAHAVAMWEQAPPLQKLDEAGTYRAPAAGEIAANVLIARVKVRFGGREAQKSLALRVRTAALRICPGTPRTLTISALDDIVSICANYYDRHDGITPQASSGLAPITARVLDTRVARPGTDFPFFVGVANGSTPVEFAGSGFADTAVITVRQKGAYARMSPPGCSGGGINLNVGETVQVSAIAPVFDRNGHLLTDAADAATALASYVWYPSFIDPSRASVTSLGLVTALRPGQTFVYATFPGGNNTNELICAISVH